MNGSTRSQNSRPTLQTVVRYPCAGRTQSRRQTDPAGPASPRPGTNPGRLLRWRGLSLSGLGGAPGVRQQHAGRHRRFAQPGPHPTGGCNRLCRRTGIPLEVIVTRRTRPPGICPQRRFPLLPLQGRIVHHHGRISQPARLRFHRLRRKPRRPGRLSSRAAGRRAAPRGRAAAPGRAHQAGYPRTVPRRRAAHMGQAGFGLPVVAHRVRARSHARGARASSNRAKMRCTRSASARSGCVIMETSCASKSPARN